MIDDRIVPLPDPIGYQPEEVRSYRPVHRLFEERAAESPAAPAVAAGGVSLTYAGLDARADRLARHLRKLGIGPESLTALLLERSPELIVSAVASHKAGGAYLPIDPAQPVERVDSILRDSGACVLVTTAPVLGRFPGLSAPAGLVLLDRIPVEGGGPAAVEEEDEEDPESLAYVIYTSGSTGVPKGAELRHRGLSNIIAWNRGYYGLGLEDRLSMVAAPGFDASLWEMWPALTSGASLHLPSREVVLSPPAFLPWAAKEGITVAFLPTPLGEAVLAEPVPAGLRLRVLQVAGDRLLRRPPPDLPFEVSNVYGPTEASIVATAALVAPEGERPPHIGRPVTNVRAHVLGPDLDSLPESAEGELCLGGVGVGRGYRHRPDLTAAAFVPDPFSPVGGERMYRTGDLVRRLPSGDLEFLGRIDHQVKIRGYRVEPGEIEAALVRHPSVRDAAVLARDGRLVGCVAPRRGDECDAEALRGFLALSLPEVMIPAAWVFLESFPLTPNGKVDRQALARIEPAAMAGAAAVAPRTPAEAAVAGIWAEVLGLGAVGVEDDFFALGGHSLLASRVASRVRDALGADPGVRGIFDHPTVAALAAWAERQEAGPAVTPLAGIQVSGPAPLSFAQQRLWFLERLRPGTAVYNLAQVTELRGGLSVAALAAAFDGLFRRHDALRTVFSPGPDGEPVQAVAAHPLDGLAVVDLDGLPAGAGHSEAERVETGEARRPYDLERGPLVRAVVLRLSGDEHRLFLGFHHIVSDGWSMPVVMRELSALYRGGELPPLPVQYPGYALWQRRRLTDELVAERVAWWRGHLGGLGGLGGAPAVLELPMDRPRPAFPSHRGGRLRLALGPGAEAGLSSWSHAQGATLFMALLAACQVLVHRWTDRDDFLLGTPVAGRDRPELEGLIGFFVNLLPLRARVPERSPFPRLLAEVRETVLAAFSRQDLPFDRLVEELAPERDASRSPLAQVVFAIQDAPAGPELDGVQTASAEVDTGTSRFDLVLVAERGGRSLDVMAEYASDLFDEGTARRILESFRTLVAGILADPDRAVDELPLLSAEEREQVLFEWNRTDAEIPEEPVHRLFFHWAERTPEAVAVAWEGGSLTYGELAGRARALADRLRAGGVGPETVVALRLERSAELLTAALAVLEAGGAYLPIDPAWPEERQRWIEEDSGAVLLNGMGGGALSREAGEGWGGGFPEGLAYVIYTSGSTGRPKGTEVCHRSLSNLVAWNIGHYGLGPGDRVSMVAAPAFDASLWEMWPALAAGASLRVPPREVALSPAAFLAWAAREGVTVAFLPTALAEPALGEPVPAGLRLRALQAGGDRLLRRPAPDAPFEMSNVYGPTECTIAATAAVVVPVGDRPPHVGRPIANLQAHVLDRYLEPMPVGAPGELCLGGEGVARGYRGRPDLTAERFVPDPFASVGGGRLYRTGDLARRLPAGDLEVLGRMDHQVKIRGHRIELGEIEAALARLSAVREAVVVVQEPEHRLVACVVMAPGEELSGERLRAALAGSLPQVMIPAAWIFLDTLPLTPNGKVDRKALARLSPVPAGSAGLAPRTPVEAAVAAIWADLLGVRPVGVADDFFALGGHSLLAVRLIDQVRKRLGVDMPLRLVFEAPTVAGLAAWIEAEHLRGPAAGPAILSGAGLPAPLSFPQQRLWFLDRLQPGSPAYNIPLSLNVSGPLRPEILAAAFAEVVRRHAALRTTFEVPEGAAEPVQVVHSAAGNALPRVDLGALPPEPREAEAARLAGGEARRPFDLRRLPLLRSTLLRLGENDHRLLATMHHIVSDGVSIELLLRELGTLCDAFSLERRSPLAELPVQYPDFAVWQRSWLAGEELERQLAWWRGRLARLPAVELPMDRPRPAVWSYRGDFAVATLPAGPADRLERLGRRHGATPFMTLLAAFLALLHRCTALTDLAVGTPVAGRVRPEIQDLIGFFVNTLVLRAFVDGGAPFAALLSRARETALAAYGYQDIPFEALVADLAPGGDLSRNPLIQVIFALENSPEPVCAGSGVTLAQGGWVHHGTAKFDLSLHASRSAAGLALWAEYATDLFDRATVQRLLGWFGNLLVLLAGDREAGECTAVQDLPLLGEGERAQVVREWSGTATDWPREATVHGLFEEQARRFPGRVALLGEEELTYAALDLRAERLAARLRGLGVGPDDRVGLCAERSTGLIAAILGILKAGGAYLPLDPRLPAERLAGMVADAEVRVLVVQEELDASLPALPALRLPLREALSREVPPGSSGPSGPSAAAGPANLACVMFTSGSTGRPKGVAVTHGNVVRLVRETNYARLDAGCVSLQLAPVAFDASTFEIWGPLLNGGRLVMFPPGPLDLRRLGEVIERHGVTTLWLTAGLFHQMVESHLERLRPVAQLLAGGDVLSPAHVRRAVAGLPGTEILNGYGPTETTTFATFHPVHAGDPEGPVPIGRALANARVYVLDAALHPSPVGVAGELYVGGDGLARGYLGRPDLTAERFVPDGVSGEPGARLYATGDLARWRPDGVLDLLGRVDHQVKLRGFRIEPGEIETALTAHPEVESAVVVAREDVPGDKRLVAYVVPVSTGAAEIAGLPAFLERRLPAYMVPAAFVFLPELPLTANGKVDRRALPAPVAPVRAASSPPRTPLEEEVARIWSEILGVERVGVEDNFWNLGGHSLLATRALARLTDTFGVEIPLQTLFLAPTLGGFSTALGEAVLAGLSDTEMGSLLEEEGS
jgi:amino acid adenylation domain-containing protein